MSVIFKSLRKTSNRSPAISPLGQEKAEKKRFQNFREMSRKKKIGVVSLIILTTAGGLYLAEKSIEDYLQKHDINVVILPWRDRGQKVEPTPPAPEPLVAAVDNSYTAETVPADNGNLKEAAPPPEGSLPPAPSKEVLSNIEKIDRKEVKYIPAADNRVAAKGVSSSTTPGSAATTTNVVGPTKAAGRQSSNIQRDRSAAPQVITSPPPSKKATPVIAKLIPENEDNRKITDTKSEEPMVSFQKAAPSPQKRTVKKAAIKSTARKSTGVYDVEDRGTIALVNKIEKAFHEANREEAKKLIDKLSKQKGENNKYVLKLRAFWHLSEGDNESALPFLEKILSEDKNDLEAGINMAIVELNSNRVKEGRDRLKALRDIYPANDLIAELLRKTAG